MDIREASEASIADHFALMRQLRPHLADAEELTRRWRHQRDTAGYRIAAIWESERPRALAGFRTMDNLIHGRFLYVDDLVADAQDRRHGHGARLMTWLQDQARATGCAKLVLDTALDNVLGHRFYYRQGLLARALRFSVELS
jgi:ribosomal protein S18 acetylase RimI-like enzyme